MLRHGSPSDGFGTRVWMVAGATSFDLMLFDVRMPGLGGPQALERIRAGQGPNRATPALRPRGFCGS